ncbi:hypothetical protein GXP67_29720 [Rhodocytophaga rosea]|uniref:Uncharacterized protein n=1 Tax=Rhodocytophaga rosea TaxID=2704465 RepID=A0A6C0GSV6_9BACT|nr:hypothetical protein [Rhodocytophaga rosea]QHT70532.1 hypothetical protein GXP67_29720 [Rhodocytophaga rosea]
MKRISSYLFTFLAFTGLSLLTSCGDDTEPTPEEQLEELPAANGTVQIKFLNYPDPASGNLKVTAASGDVLAVAVQVQKTANGNRPQKLRVYETTTINTRGKQVGDVIDLRNTDEAQIKNVNYTVPNESGPVYLYFEVDESASAFSRKMMEVTISGSAGVSAYPNLTLGAQTNAAPSRISSATGQLYTACNAAANMDDIDITYAYIGTTPVILSNPERKTKYNLSTEAKNCGDDVTNDTSGGPNTVFVKNNSADFANPTDATLSALTFTNAPESIVVAKDDIIAFRTEDGRNGLIKIDNITTGVAGTVQVSVKVQR